MSVGPEDNDDDLRYFPLSEEPAPTVSNLEIAAVSSAPSEHTADHLRQPASVDVDEQIRLIWGEWSRAAEGIISACSRFVSVEARIRLEDSDHFHHALPFPASHCSKAKKIAAASETLFADTRVRALLPTSFEYIYELASLTRPAFEAAYLGNKIFPTMTGNDVAALKGKRSRGKDLGVLVFKLYANSPLEGVWGENFRHALYEVCASSSIRPVEPKRRGPRKQRVLADHVPSDDIAH